MWLVGKTHNRRWSPLTAQLTAGALQPWTPCLLPSDFLNHQEATSALVSTSEWRQHGPHVGHTANPDYVLGKRSTIMVQSCFWLQFTAKYLHCLKKQEGGRGRWVLFSYDNYPKMLSQLEGDLRQAWHKTFSGLTWNSSDGTSLPFQEHF